MSQPADLLTTQKRGVLATIRRDGRPQLSTVAFGYDHAGDLIRVSVTDGRAKTHNLRRDPRAALHVTTPDLGAYVVVDAEATLSPVAADAGDATVDALVALYRAVSGEHPNWDEFRQTMVDDRRLVLRLRPVHRYGWTG